MTVREAAVHYLKHGSRLGLDPSPTFSTRRYLDQYPDVKKAGINPLLHFIRSGEREGRQAAPRGRGGNHHSNSIPREFNGSVCVHLHLFHVGMTDQMVSALSTISRPFTLLVSVPKGEDLPASLLSIQNASVVWRQ